MNTFHRVMAFAITLSAAFCTIAVSANAAPLTLREAITATLQHNPELAGYKFREQALQGERQTAALKPQFSVSSQLENVAGSDTYQSIDSGELTLSLSSVIELGGQRDARLGLVTARQQQLESAQRVLTLDVLTRLTHQFIAVAAMQEQLVLSQQTQDLARQTVSTLSKQVQAARTPEAELLRANAAIAKAKIDVQKTEQLLKSEQVKLSAFWADMTPDFAQVHADLFALPAAAPLADLWVRLENNPDLALLGNEVLLRTAELRQAQAGRKPSLEWNTGIRRLQATDDSAFVVGVSVPLGSSQRASGAVTTATANQAGAEQQRDATSVQLKAQLASLHQEYQQARSEIEALRSDVIPPLKKALRATDDAFQQGRYSYLELNLAQRELLAVQLALIEAAARAHRLSADLERITAAPLSAVATPTHHSEAK